MPETACVNISRERRWDRPGHGPARVRTASSGTGNRFCITCRLRGFPIRLWTSLAGGEKTGPKDILKDGVDPVADPFRAKSIIRLTWVEENDAWSLDTTASDSVTSYDELLNKPMIESVTLEGNKSFEQLGLQTMTNLEIEAILRL